MPRHSLEVGHSHDRFAERFTESLDRGQAHSDASEGPRSRGGGIAVHIGGTPAVPGEQQFQLRKQDMPETLGGQDRNLIEQAAVLDERKAAGLGGSVDGDDSGGHWPIL